MTGAPWHVKGVHPDARETARQAARRSGLSVGKWLNSIIIESAERPNPAPFFAPAAEWSAPAPSIAALNARVDELNRQIERFMRQDGRDRWDRGNSGETTGQQIADAALRLEAKLDQLIGEGKSAAGETSRRAGEIDRALAELHRERLRGSYVGGDNGLNQAVAEISARQRALDAEPAAPTWSADPPRVSAPSPAPDFSKLEQCLREVTSRLEALQAPCRAGDLVDALRQELADMRRTVAEAMPRGAIEAIESQVRALGSRIEAQRESGIDAAALNGFERALAEIREALRGLAPVESLAGLTEALARLTQKMDAIAARNQDPVSLRQLEAGIEGLRGVVAHVASADALAALAGEIRSLGDRINFNQRTDPGLMDRLEARIAAISDAIEARRVEGTGAERVDDLVRAVAGKLEGLQLNRADQSALLHLEERMAQLVAKLDASELRLGHLDAIERGVADLLVHIDQLRLRSADRSGADTAIDIAAIESLTRDIATLRESRSDTDRRTQDLLDAMHGTIVQVAERLTTIEADLRSPAQPEPARAVVAPPLMPPAVSPVAAPAAAPIAAPAPPPARPAVQAARPTKPVAVETPAAKVSELPPDTPLEPGTGAPRGTASAAERIAASEAAIATAKGTAPEQPGSAKSSFIVAARRAAQAAASEQGKGRAAAAPNAETGPDKPKLMERMKSLIGAASIIILIGGTVLAVRSYVSPPASVAETRAPARQGAEERVAADPIPATKQKEIIAAPLRPPPLPTPDPMPAQAAGPSQALAPVNILPDVARWNAPGQKLASPEARPATVEQRMPAEPDRDTTGALPRDPAGSKMSATPPTPVPNLPVPEQPPPTIGGRTLLAAAAVGDPAAAYEVGARYADGKGVTQNPAAAAAWFARAATAGLAPALFRLGSLYEKGVGVTKDLAEAHRLYVAAARKGNAKAMHNLAVLHAEGFQGKPDYVAAAQWFQKAAACGVTDSQYNLGILYARGIGVEQNLAESYKWFALAARSGDPESVKKRDDIGGRLDQQALNAARLAAQSFVPETQPEEAIAVKAPPGGWDEAAAPAKPKTRVRPRAS
jgi:localization factor PodJL